MESIFKELSDTQEKAALPWQTKRLKNHPHAIPRLALIVAAIHQNYLSSEWDLWVTETKGSITLRHKIRHQQLVRVFIDDGNRLAIQNNLQLSDEPIVIGIDLIDYSDFERYAIREHLRSHFPYYVDPVAAGEKIFAMPDYNHRLEVIFIPEGNCTLPVEESRVLAIIKAIDHEDVAQVLAANG